VLTTAKRGGFAGFLVILCTCGGLDEISFTETAQATIPPGGLVETLAGDLGFDSLTRFDITESQALANEGVQRHEIDSMRLTRLGLEVLSPDGGDLSFLERLEFYVSAPELPRVRIAHAEDFPDGASQVDLALDSVELADYAAAPSMTIDTESSGRRPAQETRLEVSLELLVDVNVDGVVCGG